MKENDWRSKLIRDFNQAYGTRGYIWANDVRYKAGFPDLEVMLNGKVAHYELKLCKDNYYRYQMSALQVAVCKRIASADIHVSCLTYIPSIDAVHINCFNNGHSIDGYDISVQIFNQRWINSEFTCAL